MCAVKRLGEARHDIGMSAAGGAETTDSKSVDEFNKHSKDRMAFARSKQNGQETRTSSLNDISLENGDYLVT